MSAKAGAKDGAPMKSVPANERMAGDLATAIVHQRSLIPSNKMKHVGEPARRGGVKAIKGSGSHGAVSRG